MTEQHSKPPPLPQTPLSYRQPMPPSGTAGRTVLRFFIGLLAGSVLSGIVWIAGWEMITSNALLVLGFPVLKFIVGLAFIFVPRWRSLGAGVLVSMALGILIFGGMTIRSAAHAVSGMQSPSLFGICNIPPVQPTSSPTVTTQPDTQPDDLTAEPSTQPAATTQP